MKTLTALSALLIAALNGLLLAPPLRDYQSYLLAGSIAVALWLALKALMAKSPAPTVAESSQVETPQPAPVIAPAPANQAEAEVLALLGIFQAKGRLIDFLKDDVSAYSDAQVGAAARVVQQGCKQALEENFEIVPVTTEKEGSRITVPIDAPPDAYRLVGKVSGEPPFNGTLVHKGWKATRVTLPRVLKVEDGQFPTLAPAQVELK